ncbi:MAG: trypsin-like peptidase domain-containing protein, partial [candidate division Zixibacteria bacterium]|nr:trypsin-like peptidase domain-containing protein [candidate division Zixibacteria bacterium]
LQGDNDYCLVRLDRPVVGREPIPIRRDGLVSTGAPLVVVGDPTSLPMKVAAGAEVKDNRPAYPWFQANTDTYGGNSGSMVVNTDTWRIEGILVRGAPDFVYNGGCAASNVVPNSGNPGPGSQFEEISKIGAIAQLIPELVTSSGEVKLDHPVYACDATVGVELLDLDLAGATTYVLSIVTSTADSELVTVSEEPPGSGIFLGTIAGTSDVSPRLDGLLQMVDGEVLTVFYHDNDDGAGTPNDVEASSPVDCHAPEISGISVSGVGVTWAKVAFQTDEPAQTRVRWGSSCGDLSQSEVGAVVSSHLITVGPLLPATSYYFVVEATDGVGNSSLDDNAGACYEFTSLAAREFYTEQFFAGCDLQGKTLAFIPDGSADFYRACVRESADFLEPVEGYTVLALSDDSYERVSVSPASVSLYGRLYSSVYVGSNGFVTFSYGNSDFSETIDEHFASPLRISVFWDDLDPSAGGQISYRQFSDRFIVTWENIPERSGSNRVSAQLRLFFDGMVDITYRLVEPMDGIVGLSEGAGTSVDFLPSDLSHYAPCQSAMCYVDSDSDSFGAAVDPGHLRLDGLCGAGYSVNNLDCDDNAAFRYPGADDLPDDTIDQNCDGVDATCCSGKVGDVNGVGGDKPSISDIAALVDHLFVTGSPLGCRQEADVNQSGGRYPALKDLTISDVQTLVDFLFVTRTPLKTCL